VEERASIAAEKGVEAIAITDHDAINEDLERRSAVKEGVEVITGVEVRANLFRTKNEILGYFANPTNPKLQSILERARRFRTERNREIVESINAVTGLNLYYNDLVAQVDGNLGRPHLAEELVDRGIVDSISEAFN